MSSTVATREKQQYVINVYNLWHVNIIQGLGLASFKKFRYVFKQYFFQQ